MSTFDLLEKRRHVRTYKTDKHPPKELIEKLLWKTWKTTPSKNNFMPYNVHVLGPDKANEKVYKSLPECCYYKTLSIH